MLRCGRSRFHCLQVWAVADCEEIDVAMDDERFADQYGKFVALARAVAPPGCKVQDDEIDDLGQEKRPYRRLHVFDGQRKEIKEFRLYNVRGSVRAEALRFYADDLRTLSGAKAIPIALPADALDALAKIQEGEPD